MPRLEEYRWLRGFSTASASFFTATSGDGTSGLPNPRSTTSSPARRASIFRASMIPKTYGGSALIRRNSIAPTVPAHPSPTLPPSGSARAEDGGDLLPQDGRVVGVGGVDGRDDDERRARVDVVLQRVGDRRCTTHQHVGPRTETGGLVARGVVVAADHDEATPRQHEAGAHT